MTEARKLAAVPAADVVGDPRLAGADEDRRIKIQYQASTPRRR